MSFRFDRGTFEDNSFNEQIREKLTAALNSSSSQSESAPSQGAKTAAKNMEEVESETKSSKKLDILKSGITVRRVNFPSIPQLEILDLDVSAQSKSLLKGICKVSCKNAMLEINTEIEANLLLLYTDNSPAFTTPRLISNDSFTVPITMTFDRIELEAITNIFVKNNSVGISFNDVNLDFKFDCSIKLLQSSIEKRLKGSMESVFRDVLPSVIFSMSQRWFTHGEGGTGAGDDRSVFPAEDHKRVPKTILDESDLENLSASNMLRLSSLVASRQSLSLSSTALKTLSTIPGCLERQNLHRFNSRIPALSTFYPDYEEEEKLMTRSASNNVVVQTACKEHANTLPQRVLDEHTYDLKTIASVQSRIYERSGGDTSNIRRRKIKIKRKDVKTTHSLQEEQIPQSQSGDTKLHLAQRPIASDTIFHSPQPLSAIQSPSVLCGEGGEQESLSGSPLSDIPQLQLPATVCKNFKNTTQKLSLLEEAQQLNHKREFQKLRSSLYSPMRNSKFCVSHELESPLLDNKGLTFVGLAQKWKWGTEDLPPPYAG
ncbi:LAMI_0D02630g1_1 [Lachancea mirantina]|uniref:Mitochondrial distribution and morphology protein 34 n=1 Tax=Lachancea mirantina TaxID=1230905 RepID=A0A1G4J997_9SACH|nr:LAMI_0D02630g1_1 [Lachancea mirantina]